MSKRIIRLCIDCGNPVNKRIKPGRPTVCAPCGALRGYLNAMGLHLHDPDTVKRWATGLAQSAMRALAEADAMAEAGQVTTDTPGRKIGRDQGYGRREMRRRTEVRAIGTESAQ